MEGLAYIIRVPERKKTNTGAEITFEEIMTEVFSKIDKEHQAMNEKNYEPKHNKCKGNLNTS